MDFSRSKTSWNSDFSAARSHTQIKQNLNRIHQKTSKCLHTCKKFVRNFSRCEKNPRKCELGFMGFSHLRPFFSQRENQELVDLQFFLQRTHTYKVNCICVRVCNTLARKIAKIAVSCSCEKNACKCELGFMRVFTAHASPGERETVEVAGWLDLRSLCWGDRGTCSCKTNTGN